MKDETGGVPNLLITSVRPPVVPLGKGDGDSRGLVATDLKYYQSLLHLHLCVLALSLYPYIPLLKPFPSSQTPDSTALR